ncbi:MAG: DUF5615 family PIN-like protein [Cyanobacteria bacterium J06626_18]
MGFLEDILNKARAEVRIVLTVDLDFGYLLAISQSMLPSVVLFRLGNASREVVEARLTDVLTQCAEDLQPGPSSLLTTVRSEYDRCPCKHPFNRIIRRQL